MISNIERNIIISVVVIGAVIIFAMFFCATCRWVKNKKRQGNSGNGRRKVNFASSGGGGDTFPTTHSVGNEGWSTTVDNSGSNNTGCDSGGGFGGCDSGGGGGCDSGGGGGCDSGGGGCSSGGCD